MYRDIRVRVRVRAKVRVRVRVGVGVRVRVWASAPGEGHLHEGLRRGGLRVGEGELAHAPLLCEDVGRHALLAQ